MPHAPAAPPAGGEGEGGSGEGEGGGGEGGGGDAAAADPVAQAPAQQMWYCGLVFLNAMFAIVSGRTVQPVHVGAVLTPIPPPEQDVPQSEPPGPLPASHSRWMLTAVPHELQLFGTLKKACFSIANSVELYAILIVTMPSCLKLSSPSELQLGVTSRQVASPPSLVSVTSASARYVSLSGGDGHVAALLTATKHTKLMARINDEAGRGTALRVECFALLALANFAWPSKPSLRWSVCVRACRTQLRA